MCLTSDWTTCAALQTIKYYVPFITAGVKITVDDGKIVDMSGEVILIRMGDRVCLTCLKRLKFNEIAKQIPPDKNVREGLVRKGYVQGLDVKESAVKTLNTHLTRTSTACGSATFPATYATYDLRFGGQGSVDFFAGKNFVRSKNESRKLN